MSKLTDTQMLVLASACERADGIATRPEALNRTAVVKVAAKLFEQGLVQEMPAKLGWPIWRMDEKGRAFSLKILKPGRAVVKAAARGAVADAVAASTTGSSHAVEAGKREDAALSAATALPKAGSKRNLLLAMMQREEGATIGDLTAATGWLPHTTRAALTGLRKSGIAIARTRDPQVDASVYRIEAAAAAASV